MSRIIPDLSKLEPLDGNNYKRWSQKLLMFFEQLESKYGSDDAGKKKYVVGKWLEFVMQDGKPIMEQVHIYENLCADVVNEGMKLCDKKDLSLQELVGHMRTEEANRLKDKPVSLPINIAKVNLIESSGLSYAANLVGNVAEWILDTGASRHFCADKGLFTEFEEVADGECVYMGKTLALNNVLYVPSLRRNLVSGALLNKGGMKLVFEADKVVMSRNEDFVGKGYLSVGLFILNTDSVLNNNISTSSYIAESIDIWHGRLGHVNVDSIKKLRTMNLIPSLTSKEFSKCASYVEAKFTKKPSKPVKTRNTSLLELIHTDLADFKST
ncbi:hypothetical protein RND81_10G031300 [Saponaria officinalis]|uniref:GAG-pre-integrase domain-containing protein n=1 Tax=Saponaria officinalis TaxID=3572 RepID=A0AAW1I0A1_SAPOF